MRKISKYDVLSLLAKKLPFYAATQWLKASNPELEGKTPSELLEDGYTERVYKALEKDLKDS